MRLVLTFVLSFLAYLVSGQDLPALKISWDLETNYLENDQHRATWTFTNTSDITLTNQNWALYWNMIQRDIVEDSESAHVTINWINGDYFQMKPKPGFSLTPGDSIMITYRGEGGMIKISDAPTGIYLAYSDGDEHLIPILDYEVKPFVGEEQINRSPTDKEPIPTAEWLFEQNNIVKPMAASNLIKVLPTPDQYKLKSGSFIFKSEHSIVAEPFLNGEAEFLKQKLEGLINFKINIVQEANSATSIILSLDETMGEAYELSISKKSVEITGGHAGVFYGIQSLVSLIDVGQTGDQIAFPLVKIEDKPAFAYRGMHLDLARNYNSPETVKRLIDVMAAYKLNKLQLRLTDDEAWRLEIEELPELTEVGAKRGHPGKYNLQPSYGSGPIANEDTGHGTGYLSREEYIDLVSYAADRHIEVIPEICVPSHALAAITAMEYRYQKFMSEGKPERADEFRLIDPQDKSEGRSAQWYNDNTMCVCRESTYKFFTTVVDDVLEMHELAGSPVKIFHTGGDEVTHGAWEKSPLCQDYLATLPNINYTRNLHQAYFEKITNYLISKGVKSGGWEEVAKTYYPKKSSEPNPKFATGEVIPYVWNSLWGDEDLGNRLANTGYPVVLCNVTNFYFDLAYNKDPREPGLYWAGFIDTRDGFDFVPYDVFKSIKVSDWGRPYKDSDFTYKEKLEQNSRGNILGIQGQLWSETIKGQDMLEYYYLPKIFALAERAWSGQADWGDIEDRLERTEKSDEDWSQFANRIGQLELPKLEELDYNYRIAPPGIRVAEDRILINTPYPGFLIRYTTDGSEPDLDSELYTIPFETTSKIIKAKTFNQNGRSSYSTTLTFE